MAKKAILDVLENTIGKYVRNLDAESLNVAVWSGNIELHSLELNVDAVNAELDRQAAEAPNLALPFKVVDGSFSSFEVEVPWARISSRPVVFTARGLKILVEPCDRLSQHKGLIRKNYAKKEAKKIVEARSQSLKLANENRLRSNAVKKLAEDIAADEEDEKDGASKSTFGTRLVRRILENLQVEINDVHISLRDSGSSAGIVLDSLSLSTTDKNGKRSFIDRTSDRRKDPASSFLYKSLEIKGFGIYLDDLSSNYTPFTVSEEKQLIADTLHHSYILSPLSFEAKLRQSDSVTCIDFPKYVISSELSQLSILLTRNQLELGNRIALSVRPPQNVARPLFPEYRPLYSVSKETAKEWWKYAFRCVRRLSGRSSWIEFFKAFQKRKKYICLYKRQAYHASFSWIHPLTPEEVINLEEIESDRSTSIEGIMAWRTIAEAQADREKKKHEAAKRKSSAKFAKTSKSSMLSSFFTTKDPKADTTDTEEDDPPIALTAEEVQELEAISFEAAEAQLSDDSRLCDINFVLNSFKVDLISHAMRPIAAFEMGTVTTNFDAHADGSFTFDFKLSSVNVHDKATLKSLFPTIVRSLQSSSRSKESVASYKDAMRFRLDKSKTGDQKVLLHIVAFEMVASSLLLAEVKRFFSLSKNLTSPNFDDDRNPMLRQSVGGSVDLFYDAGEGIDETGLFAFVDETAGAAAAAARARVSDQLSSALADAWKNKTRTKNTWTIDCDIHAPIIVVPQSCTNAGSNALIFNLGRLTLKYGNIKPSSKVIEWFSHEPKRSNIDAVVDHGTVAISNLTFFTAKTGDLHGLDWSNEMKSTTVVDPVTLTLHFGIESTASEEPPRTCAFGVLPVVCLRISPSQITDTFSVIDTWKSIMKELSNNDDIGSDGITIVEESDGTMTGSSSTSVELGEKHGASKTGGILTASGTSPTNKEVLTMMHLEMSLQRLSVHALSDAGDGMEAHLVSVSVLTSNKSDGSSSARLRMGWFWILDRLQCDFPRLQRLVAHSKLPTSAALLSRSGYDVMGDLSRQGVFDEGFRGSSDLADITWNSSQLTNGCDALAWQVGTGDEVVDQGVVDAKFTSLFIHWNPKAVKSMTVMKEKFLSLIQELSGSELSDLQSPTSLTSAHTRPSHLRSIAESTIRRVVSPAGKIIVINAEMESLEISLNSARDDLPLFVGTMCGTKVNLDSSQDGEQNMRASLVLGDVRIEGPSDCGTHHTYKTLLGLAPNQSASLLSVNYCMGTKAIQSLSFGDVDVSGCEACAQIELSPMRFVHIHAQVFTLVEYVTEGILGTLFAKAASSAAEAALEIANSVTGGKIFAIKATGAELVLPKAAHSPDYFCLQAGDLDIYYHALPDPVGGSTAKLSLSDVSLRDNLSEQMVDTPVRMLVDLKIPPVDVGSHEDRTMLVDIDISQAAFILSKPQYDQMLGTFERNISEKNPFLRNNDPCKVNDQQQLVIPQKQTGSLPEVPPNEGDIGEANITHAGVKVVENIRRMTINFEVAVVSLELCDKDAQDPIVRLAAVKTCIHMRMIPDQQRSIYDVTLHNLVCEDRRLKAMGLPFRSLVSQVNQNGVGNDQGPEDVFKLAYVKHTNGSSEVDLKIGSPQLVFVPDAISDVLKFTRIEKEQTEAIEAYFQNKSDSQDILINDDESQGSTPVPTNVANMTITISTSNCSLVLIDSGNRSDVAQYNTSSTNQQITSDQITETIVLQGALDAKLLLVSELKNKRTIKTDLQAHGDGMQIYSAHGRELKSPLQIVEPARFSLFYVSKATGENSKDIDVRAVTLSPIEIIFSMQNAALLHAITSSFSESLKGAGEQGEIVALSEKEIKRIEMLESALETSDNGLESEASLLGKDASSVDGSTHSGTTPTISDTTVTVRGRITMPETRVTVINDLQGLDEALFRVTVQNFVAGLELNDGAIAEISSPKQLTFDLNINTSILADYFDSSTNLWRTLLLKPWEITLKAARGLSKRYRSHRLSSTIDLESFPCHVAFSEHFLASLAAASRTWSIYSLATEEAATLQKKVTGNVSTSSKSMAATAARSLITALPYAVENHSGVDAYFSLDGREDSRRICQNGCVQYFRFEPAPVEGYGGRRLYGQDASQLKSVTLFICGTRIKLSDVDAAAISAPRSAYEIGDGLFALTHVVKEGKTTVIHISSQIDIRNQTSVPFSISVANGDEMMPVGLCEGRSKARSRNSQRRRSSLLVHSGADSVSSQNFGVPIHVLNFNHKLEGDAPKDLILLIHPHLRNTKQSVGNEELMCGSITLPIRKIMLGILDSETKFDVVCSARPNRTKASTQSLLDNREAVGRKLPDPFAVQVRLKTHLVDDSHAFIEVFLEPRALLTNRMPVTLHCRTPMPHTFSSSLWDEELSPDHAESPRSQSDVLHKLKANDSIEIYTPGPSIAIKVRCADDPVGGGATGWMDGGWVDLPLVPEFRLPEPLRYIFPFIRGNSVDPLGRSAVGGSEFFIAEDSEALSELMLERERRVGKDGSQQQSSTRQSRSGDGQELSYPLSDYDRKFLLTVSNYAVDHTGDVLFEQVLGLGTRGSKLRKSFTDEIEVNKRRSSMEQLSTPFSAFSSIQHRRRITLLPDSTVPLRLLHLTMEGDEGIKRSLPFRVEDLAISEGGIESTSIQWENNAPSGYFAYRKLTGAYQSEIHVIPEFIVFNGSKNERVLLKQKEGIETIIEPGKFAPFRSMPKTGLTISLDFIDIGGRTVPFPCATLGLRICLVKAANGSTLGSVAVQTVIGAADSRLVVKIGRIKLGAAATPRGGTADSATSMFTNDFLRFRVRWSELQLTLNEASPIDPDRDMPIIETALDQIVRQQNASPKKKTWIEARKKHFESEGSVETEGQRAVTTISFLRFTVDYQRIFKDVKASDTGANVLLSPERTQISVIVHNIRIKDCNPQSPYPVVFDSTSANSFFDLCIRIRGPLDADLVKVDLFDLNLAYANGKSERIVVETSEEFVWKLLDVANRILVATAELAGIDLKLEWDEEHGGFVVSVADDAIDYSSEESGKNSSNYKPPDSDRLYDIHTAKVSPLSLLVSFKRQPQAKRYKRLRGVKGAKLMNYFTRRLKFQIDKADLNFSRYSVKNVKGPPDRLIELIKAHYVSKMKLKLVTLMTAVSVQDWKYLASRVDGNDSYQEGDVARAGGNLVGASAGYVLNKVGRGLGEGVSAVTDSLGDGIENATAQVGAGAVGVGVSSVITGLGDGVGNTVKGVGAGAGEVFKGAGKGIGHVVGGVTGGALLIGKGIGKGVSKGDGSALVGGIRDGAMSVGSGFGEGVGSVVTGAADGVLTAGNGLFKGVKSVGKGFGGVFTGKRNEKEKSPKRR